MEIDEEFELPTATFDEDLELARPGRGRKRVAADGGEDAAAAAERSLREECPPRPDTPAEEDAHWEAHDEPCLVHIDLSAPPLPGAVRPVVEPLQPTTENATVTVADLMDQFSYLPAEERMEVISRLLVAKQLERLQQRGLAPHTLTAHHQTEVERMRKAMVSQWRAHGAAVGAPQCRTPMRDAQERATLGICSGERQYRINRTQLG